MKAVKIYKAELELENYRTQAMVALKLYINKNEKPRDIMMKIDSGSSVTIIRNVTVLGLGVQIRAIGAETYAIAANGVKFIIQQAQLIGILEIGKIRIENPIIYITKPKTKQDIESDSKRSNLLGFDLISCCTNFSIDMPSNYNMMTVRFLFRSDRLERYCSEINAPDNQIDEIDGNVQ